jgi:DNA-binding protein H-NS
MEYQELSYEEARERLKILTKEQAVLSQIVDKRRSEAKHDFVRQLLEMIDDQGYELDEIIKLLKKRRNTNKRKIPDKAEKKYIKYVDPENSEHIYVRGVLPKWMKRKMIEQGYDPARQEDRKAFKQHYLQAI